MTASVPALWPAVLLALAAYRTWHLIALDVILERPRDWLVLRAKREGLVEFITCGWCAGFWVSLAWWGSWLAVDEWAVWAAFPMAVSTVVGVLAKDAE